MSKANEIEGTTPHDLFLPTDDDPTLILAPSWINVVRLNHRGQQIDTSGGVIPANEIPDVATLHARYGGGYYEVFARDARKHVIGRRRLGPLPGVAKPLYAADNGLDDEQIQSAISAPSMPMPPPPQPGTDLNAIAALIQGQREFMAAMMQQMQGASAQAMERERQAGRESQAQQQQFTTTIVTMLTDVLKQKNEIPAQIANGGTQTPMELMLAGMEIANGMHAQARENAGVGSGGDDIATTIELVSKGVEALEKLKNGNAAVPIPSAS